MAQTEKRIPCTKQIAKDLEQQILDGILRPGMKLESVRDLAVRYRTCTSVCLSVYRTLEKKGLIQRERGKGTFVCGTLPPEAHEYVTFWNWISPFGKTTAFLEGLFRDFGMDNWKLNPFHTDEYNRLSDYVRFAGRESLHPGTLSLDEGLFPVLADQNMLYPLDDLLEKSELLHPSDFHSKLLDLFRYRGKLYALPFSYSPTVLLYNKRLFRWAGLPEPSPDWNWEDLFRNTKLLTKCSKDRSRIHWYGLGILFTVNSFAPFIFQNGGSLFDWNGNCVINSDPSFEALNFFTELYALPGVCSHKFGDPRSALSDMLRNDLMAMMIADALDYRYLAERMPESDFGAIPLPRRILPGTSLSCHGWAIHRNCRSPETHFRFFERLFTASPLTGMDPYSAGFPAFRSAENQVPTLFLDVLNSARPVMTSPSPDALRFISETISPLLGHKMVLTRDRARDFERKINKSL